MLGLGDNNYNHRFEGISSVDGFLCEREGLAFMYLVCIRLRAGARCVEHSLLNPVHDYSSAILMGPDVYSLE